MRRGWLILTLILLLAAGCGRNGAGAPEGEPRVLRLGYLANLTHGQAIVGVADGRLGKSTGVKVEARVFATGPAAMTALLAGELDALYVGPSPAVNGYIRSNGKALCIVAGAASGGAVFVARPGFDPSKLDGARLATPGLANTQDIALRNLLESRGLKTRENGGTVTVATIPPADMLGLFSRGALDGAWVVEPWGTRLMQEAGAVLVLDERELWPNGRYATTVLVVSTRYLEQSRAAVAGLVRDHVAITRWMQENPAEAQAAIQAGLARLQGGKALPDNVLTPALSRIEFLWDPMNPSVMEQAKRAHSMGYLGVRLPDLDHLYDLTILKEVAP